jgi:hypothetical protein
MANGRGSLYHIYIYNYAAVSYEVQNVFCISRRIFHFQIQNTDLFVKSVIHIEICLEIKFYIF